MKNLDKLLDKLKEQYEKLGKEIEVLEHANRYQDITVAVPVDSNLFREFRRSVTLECSFVIADIRLYEPTLEAYTFDEAVNKFNNPNTGRLMTKQEIHHLIAVGILNDDDENFWSSSVYYTGQSRAWSFHGSNGRVDSRHWNNSVGVRCVGPNK